MSPQRWMRLGLLLILAGLLGLAQLGCAPSWKTDFILWCQQHPDCSRGLQWAIDREFAPVLVLPGGPPHASDPVQSRAPVADAGQPGAMAR